LLLLAPELLLHPDPGLLPDGGYPAVFYGMAIIKTFLRFPLIACLLVEPLLTGTNERLPVKAAPDGPFCVPRWWGSDSNPPFCIGKLLKVPFQALKATFIKAY
jgi:hypothetical protein